MAANSFDTPMKCKWFCYLCVDLLIALTASTNAYASNNSHIEKDYYKLYSHNKLTNHNEYLCLVRLWDRESRWNPKADNKHSTAYGIPQLLKLKTKDPYKQIDAGLKYISHRYGTACKALAVHLKTGTY